MALKETVKRQLETDKEFLASMLRLHKRADATVLIDEEPGEVLITLLMTNHEILKAIKKAVEEVFGVNVCCSDDAFMLSWLWRPEQRNYRSSYQ